MSLSNSGFDGTVTELPFAFMWGVGVGGDAVESAAAWAVTQGTGRQVSVAAQNGYAFGHGILSKETSAAILQALSTPVAGGWFLICRHIDWTTNTVSVVALTGPTSTTTIPTVAPADFSGVTGMANSPGVTYDHPLAWAWVRNTDTTMALFDLRKLPPATRILTLEGLGAIRSGATGGSIWEVATVAALDALTLAKIGDIAYMSDPGNGVASAGAGTIDAVKWEAFSGSGSTLKWRVADTLVADTKAHLDAFLAALPATDLQVRVGDPAFVVAGKRTYLFTSTAGAYIISAVPVRMIPTGSTGVTVDAQTGIAVSTAQTVVTLSAGFADPYTDYNIFYDFTGSGATTSLQAQLLDASGTPISAGTLYDVYRTSVINSTVTSGPLMAQNNIPLSGGAAGAAFRHRGRISLRAARDAAIKLFETHQLVTAVPGAAATGGQVSLDGVLNSTALLTGITFIAATAGTITANEIYIEAVPK